MNDTIIIGINCVDNYSSGNIMRNTLEYANKHGNYDYLVVVPNDFGKPNTYGYTDKPLNILLRIIYLFYKYEKIKPDGFFGVQFTKRIIRIIKQKCKTYEKIIINLHTLHGAKIDIRPLFRYLGKNNKIVRVFYTLHDEWAFTAGCYTFGYYKCTNWQIPSNCHICENNGRGFQLKGKSSKYLFETKKKYTLLMKNKLILVPVSNWLSEQINKSFLRDITSIVIHGECMFDKNSTILMPKTIEEKPYKIILIVSSHWYISKGGKYVYEISKRIPKNYLIITIGSGFSSNNLPNIVTIPSIKNEELPFFYSIADVLVSVSQEESLGLTPCEAQIFGTPVVTFGHGGLKETIIDGVSGILVGEDNDVNKMVKAIINIIENKPFKKANIIKSGNRFKKYEHAKKMLKLFNQC